MTAPTPLTSPLPWVSSSYGAPFASRSLVAEYLEHRLDRVRRQRRSPGVVGALAPGQRGLVILPALRGGSVVRFEHDGGQAGDHRGRHAGSVESQEGGKPRPHEQRRVAGHQRAGESRVRNEARTRGDDVGLGDAVIPGRPARAVVGDAVVSAEIGAEGVRRADGDRRRSVTGRGDAGVAGLAGDLIGAVVAGRRDDDEAGAHRSFHGLHERVGRGRLVDRMAERKVDDTDAEPVLVGNRELERGDDRAGLASAVSVEHAQREQLDARRHARELPVRGRAARANQAGDVRAVAVLVRTASPRRRSARA